MEEQLSSRDGRIQIPPNCEVTLGMECVDKSVPGRTVWTMPADERFANPVGNIQGGFLSAMADSAMGSATITWARAAGQRVFTSNAEMKISFIAPARSEGTLICTAQVISGGRRIVFAESEIVDGNDRIVARASSTYVLTPRD